MDPIRRGRIRLEERNRIRSGCGGLQGRVLRVNKRPTPSDLTISHIFTYTALLSRTTPNMQLCRTCWTRLVPTEPILWTYITQEALQIPNESKQAVRTLRVPKGPTTLRRPHQLRQRNVRFTSQLLRIFPILDHSHPSATRIVVEPWIWPEKIRTGEAT